MRIGVVLNILDEEYQISVYKGIVQKAQELDVELVCFQQENSHITEDEPLSRFPNKEYFDLDGIILVTSVITGNAEFVTKADVERIWGNLPVISVGQKIEGEISRVADFGLFVNLSKGIDGLVHISELEGISASTNIKKIYQPGQKMSVVIEKIDASARRISLKPASSAEQDKTAEKYLSSQDDDGETYNPFAALLKK